MFKLFLFVAFVVAQTEPAQTKNNACCQTFESDKCTECISNQFRMTTEGQCVECSSGEEYKGCLTCLNWSDPPKEE